MTIISDAFRVDALSIQDAIVITQGTSDPRTGAGVDAPVGSVFLDSVSGISYTKRGSLSTQWIPSTDELVKVSATDTTPGYILTKLVAGNNVTITQNNISGNETVSISTVVGVSTVTNVTTPTYTTVLTDNILLCSGTTITLTTPTLVGQTIDIKNIGTNSINIQPASGVLIDGKSLVVITKKYTNIRLVFDGNNWFIL